MTVRVILIVTKMSMVQMLQNFKLDFGRSPIE